MAVITVSREYGSRGEQIAQKVAAALGYSYFDKELLTDVARVAKTTEEQVSLYDEKGEHGLRSFLKKLFVSSYPYPTVLGEYYPPGLPLEWSLEPTEMYPAFERQSNLNPDEIVAFFRDVVEKLWSHGNVVIVGRGGQKILETKPNTFHVRFVASTEDRCQYVMEREGIPYTEASKKIEKVDNQRAQYLKHHYDSNWADAIHYHLVINTSLMDVNTAVKVITTAVRKMEKET